MFGRMFSFLLDAGNRESRLIKNDKVGEATIDTCRVSDGKQPYETGISHPEYDSGQWIIAEAYNTPDAALKGHKKWVKIMSAKKLPKEIPDCNNALLTTLLD